MKKIVITLLSIFVFSLNYIQANNEKITTAKRGLRIRTSPSLNGTAFGLIPFNTKVTVIEEHGETITLAGTTGKWCKVKWNNKTGWVFGGFLASVQSTDTDKNSIINLEQAKEIYFKMPGDACPVPKKILLYSDFTVSGMSDGGVMYYEYTGTWKYVPAGPDGIAILFSISAKEMDKGDPTGDTWTRDFRIDAILKQNGKYYAEVENLGDTIEGRPKTGQCLVELE